MVASAIVFSLRVSCHPLVRQPGLPYPTTPPEVPEGTEEGQDRHSLVPAPEVAAGSQMASEISWTAGLTG